MTTDRPDAARMRRPARALPAVAVLVLLGALASAVAAAAGPGLVWAVEAGRGTVYIAGSVHALPPAAPLPAEFDVAYEAAEQLVMEIDMDELDVLALQAYFLERGSLADGRTLRDLYARDRYEELAARAAAFGLPLDGLQQLEPWAIALILSDLQLARAGLVTGSGVEQRLLSRARVDGKPISGLETAADQLDALDGLAYDEQARFLELSIDDTHDGAWADDLDGLISAWQSGDVPALERVLAEQFDALPALYGPLVSDRNARWLPQIEALLLAEQDTLVVVGALHVVGDDGVLRLLERRGFEPRRLRAAAP